MTFPYNPVGLSSVIKLVSQYLFACSLTISMVVTIGRERHLYSTQHINTVASFIELLCLLMVLCNVYLDMARKVLRKKIT